MYKYVCEYESGSIGVLDYRNASTQLLKNMQLLRRKGLCTISDLGTCGAICIDEILFRGKDTMTFNVRVGGSICNFLVRGDVTSYFGIVHVNGKSYLNYKADSNSAAVLVFISRRLIVLTTSARKSNNLYKIYSNGGTI